MLAVGCGVQRVFLVLVVKLDVAEVAGFEASLKFVNVAKDHSVVQVDLGKAAVADL